MVNAANTLGCKVFLGTGSQAEYGSVDAIITPDLAVNPNTCYGAAKFAAGYLSRALCRQKGITHIWARLFSVFGENDRNGSFVNYLIETLMKNKNPSLTRCYQIWNYMYSKDLAYILYSLARRGRDGETYCVGSKNSRSLREYGEDIRNVVNPGMELGFGDIPYKENQVMKMMPDVSKLIRDIGDFKETPFDEAIKMMCERKRNNVI
jgi:nucleoside-diphosphate-sugar epimerase